MYLNFYESLPFKYRKGIKWATQPAPNDFLLLVAPCNLAPRIKHACFLNRNQKDKDKRDQMP
jgi:hypothetical protein